MRERNWPRRYWWHLPRSERRRLRGVTPEEHNAELWMQWDRAVTEHCQRMTALVADAFRRAAERDAWRICPACGLRTCDVAEDYDPFSPDHFGSTSWVAISASCANKHTWIVGWTRDGEISAPRLVITHNVVMTGVAGEKP